MLLDPAQDAWQLIARHVVDVHPGWLSLGCALLGISQLVRTRGWYTIIRAACPRAKAIRARNVMAASMAGAGLNGVLPARSGDVVKLWLLHRRTPDEAPYAPLAATLVPEGLFEAACGAVLVVWALSLGFLPLPSHAGELPTLDVSVLLHHPLACAGVLVALAVAGVLLARRVGGRLRAFARRARPGLKILRSPRLFLTGVVSWQALSRVIRLGSLAAFMAAFGLPVTFSTALLVMAAQGGGRIIPIAPVSAGLRLAMLSYGFVEVTGQSIDMARILTFTTGVGAATLAVNLALGAGGLMTELRASPRRAFRMAREAVVARG